MTRFRVVATFVLASLALGGCASNPLSDSLSSVQVCAASVGILTSMEEVLRSALANPMEVGASAERLEELSAQFDALSPTDETLAAAHAALGSQIDVILATVENPDAAGLLGLPNLIAESQTALQDYIQACTP